MPINFPLSPSLNDTYTYLTKTWKWNGAAWQRSAATETGNVEGNTGEIAYYYEKGSNIQGATAFFYAGDKIGIGTSGPTETLDVRGGITASGGLYVGGGATFDEVTVRGGITASGGLYVGGGATFGGNLGLTGSSFIMFPDGTTQSQGALTRYTHDSATGASIKDVGGPDSEHVPSIFDIYSEDLSVSLSSGMAMAGPEYLLRYVLSVGSNMPVLDGSSQTWTGTNGNVFTTPIGSKFYAGGSALEVLRSIADSSATHMGVTAGEITFKVSGTDILSLDTDIHAHVGISADAGITFGGAINCQDQEVTRPKLKDYSETALATSSKSASFNVDFESGNVQSFTFADDLTVSFTNPPASGTAGTVTLIIANGGANTTTWNSAVKWPGDNAPALTSSGTDIVSFMTIDAGTTIYGFVGGINFS